MGGRSARLDGVRGIGIALVVLCHTARVIESRGIRIHGLSALRDWGSVGVTTFFVLSGFLITSLLLKELRQTRTISLGDFYARRAFRILPAFWAFLAGIAVLTALHVVDNPLSAFARSFFFASDYASAGTWSLGHSWSLSVEEQFYLFWPALLIAVGPRRARWIAQMLIIATPLVRIITAVGAPDLTPAIANMLHTRVDALMVGCLAALDRAARNDTHALESLAKGRTAALALVFNLLVAPLLMNRYGYAYLYPVGLSLEAFAACSIVLWGVSAAPSAAGRLFETRWLVQLGAISYSLYLWQEPFLDASMPISLGYLPLRMLLAVGFAWMSYRFVEQPFLALRARLRETKGGSTPAIAG
jgi:peptidoglycan/LPS O-acetylase OafA/YrhL